MQRLLLGLFVLMTVTVSAQITITNADMPSVNDTFRITTAIDTAGIDPSLTGINYTWSFLDFVPTAQRIDTFFSVTSTPVAYQFYFNNGILYPNHQATYALRGQDIGLPQVPITEVFNYTKNSSQAYDNVGFGSKISGVPSSTRNIPVDREYEFPANYLNTHSSFASYLISVPGFGAYGQDLTRNDTIDGWGTVTTPFGTYNCLRIKSTLIKIDTTYIDALSLGSKIPRPEEIEYKWLANGMGIPIMKIVTTSGVISTIEYQDINRPGVGVEEYAFENLVELYPNPTNQFVYVRVKKDGDSICQLSMFDLSGKKLVEKSVVLSELNKGVKLNLSSINLSKGIYFVAIRLDEQNTVLKKLIVN